MSGTPSILFGYRVKPELFVHQAHLYIQSTRVVVKQVFNGARNTWDVWGTRQWPMNEQVSNAFLILQLWKVFGCFCFFHKKINNLECRKRQKSRAPNEGLFEASKKTRKERLTTLVDWVRTVNIRWWRGWHRCRLSRHPIGQWNNTSARLWRAFYTRWKNTGPAAHLWLMIVFCCTAEADGGTWSACRAVSSSGRWPEHREHVR